MSNDSLLVFRNASSSSMDSSTIPRLAEPANSAVPSTTLLATLNLDILLNYILFFLLFFIIVLFFVLYLEMKSSSSNSYVDLERSATEEDIERKRQKRREAINRAIHSI